jgi:hypothetical protein
MESGRLLMNNPDAELKYIVEQNGQIDVQRTLRSIQEARASGTMEILGENGVRRIAHQLAVNQYKGDLPLSKDAGTTEPEQVAYIMKALPGIKKDQFRIVDGRVYFNKFGTLDAPVRAKLVERFAKIEDRQGGHPLGWLRYAPLPLHDVNNYFPHVMHDPAAARKYLEARIEEMGYKKALESDLSRTKLEVIMEFARANALDGGETEGFSKLMDDMYEPVDAMGEPLGGSFGDELPSRSDVVIVKPVEKPVGLKVPTPRTAADEVPNYWNQANTKQRSTSKVGLMPGWDKSVEALKFYGRQKIQGYHNMLFTMMGNQITKHFEDSNPLGQQTKAWAQFMKMYMRQVVGQPSTIPDEFLQDKNFARAVNPYRYFSDQFWLERIRSINKKLDLKPGDEIKMEDIKNINADQAILRKITAASNLEAKWELMSLLSHTKTMVNNLAGANTNSAIEVGFSPLKAAWSFGTMQRKVRSLLIDGKIREVKSEQDLWDFAEEHGGMETFVARQIDWTPELQATNWSNATKEMLEIAKQKGFKGLTTEQFGELAKKHGLGAKVIEKAAWFMRVTEVSNRRRAWWAGYMKARELLDATEYTFESNDPWLIHIANRTVEATQFLYNNASRPAFAATNVGKIFTRFQLYAYNSLAFRGNILRFAKQAGYQKDSEEMKRFERMAMMDLFALTMAGMFPASMFDANLMEPWKTFQGVAQMLFGSEEEKKKAFFGTLPYPANILQPISPPISRAIYPIFTGLLTGEWDRYTSYTVWTLAPFGRLAKDAVKFQDNPTMVLENFMGLPVHALNQAKQKAKKKTEVEPIHGLIGSAWSGF